MSIKKDDTYDLYIKDQLRRELEISKIEQDYFFTIYNKDGSTKGNKSSLLLSSKSSKPIGKSSVALEIDIDSMEWVEVTPKKKGAEKYELANDWTNPNYKKLRDYIEKNREGYAPVKYSDYKFSIIKTGIMRRRL
jgi:hypothetical protein